MPLPSCPPLPLPRPSVLTSLGVRHNCGLTVSIILGWGSFCFKPEKAEQLPLPPGALAAALTSFAQPP